jgi:hypothetical protein
MQYFFWCFGPNNLHRPMCFDHLLIHCEYTVDFWHLVLNSFGVSRVMPSNILQLLHCWKYLGQGHPNKAIWKVISALLMWIIGERNRRLFENSETNVFFLKSSFLRSLLDWAIVYVFNFPSGNLVHLICFLDFNSI